MQSVETRTVPCMHSLSCQVKINVLNHYWFLFKWNVKLINVSFVTNVYKSK